MSPLTYPEHRVCADLKCGILPLAVETGCVHSTLVEDRKCVIWERLKIKCFCSIVHHMTTLDIDFFHKTSAKCLNLSDECRLKFLVTDEVFHFVPLNMTNIKQPL